MFITLVIEIFKHQNYFLHYVCMMRVEQSLHS